MTTQTIIETRGHVGHESKQKTKTLLMLSEELASLKCIE
jgi:hypothetical protein